MTLKLDTQYDEAQGLVQAVFRGKALPEDVVAAYQSIEEVANRHQCDKLLVDVRQLDLDYDGAAIMAIMHSLKRMLSQFRIARVVNMAQYKQDLIEGIAASAGYRLKNFSDEQDARTWLTGQG